MGSLALYEDVIAEIAARLDLREPNREAVRTINAAVSQYYDVEEQLPPFEAVVDSATGVGKTYILIAAMELFAAAYGVRDFVIVTPGRNVSVRPTSCSSAAARSRSALRRGWSCAASRQSVATATVCSRRPPA